MRNVAGKVMLVGRATVFLVGLAVVLAVLFGAASAARWVPTASRSCWAARTRPRRRAGWSRTGPGRRSSSWCGPAAAAGGRLFGEVANLNSDQLDGKS
ncbi:MAG: hypothetical protein M3341_03580 [Actinomycetota bacterium]|nr:hypothetical protein [Actinomycetota bacterium]